MSERPTIDFHKIFPSDGTRNAKVLYVLYTDASPASEEAKKLLTDAGIIFKEMFFDEDEKKGEEKGAENGAVFPFLSIKRRSLDGIDFIRWYTRIHKEDAVPPPPPILYTGDDENSREAKQALTDAGIEFVEKYWDLRGDVFLFAAEGVFRSAAGIRKYIRYMEALGKIPVSSQTK